MSTELKIVEGMFSDLKTLPCPRPANRAPDNLTVQDCITRGECGCDFGAAEERRLAETAEHAAEPRE